MKFIVRKTYANRDEYEVKLAPLILSRFARMMRFVSWLILCFVIGWLFPNQVNAILERIPFLKKD